MIGFRAAMSNANMSNHIGLPIGTVETVSTFQPFDAELRLDSVEMGIDFGPL